MKKYNYFISFTFVDQNGFSERHGNETITIDSLISDINDIRTIEKDLKERQNLQTIIINNFIILNAIEHIDKKI